MLGHPEDADHPLLKIGAITVKKPGHYIDNCWKRKENLRGKKKTNLGATPDSGKTGPTQVQTAEAAVQSDKEDPAEN